MQVAESYLDQDAFYFPHNLDFRGRAYPMHPNLNHLGADLSRGLLQFADAKPLGPDGLKWLEISVSLHHTLVHSQNANSSKRSLKTCLKPYQQTMKYSLALVYANCQNLN